MGPVGDERQREGKRGGRGTPCLSAESTCGPRSPTALDGRHLGSTHGHAQLSARSTSCDHTLWAHPGQCNLRTPRLPPPAMGRWECRWCEWCRCAQSLWPALQCAPMSCSALDPESSPPPASPYINCLSISLLFFFSSILTTCLFLLNGSVVINCRIRLAALNSNILSATADVLLHRRRGRSLSSLTQQSYHVPAHRV